MPGDWLADAVLYEIYPQSFADSDGDGIGDLRGVIDRLDHIASLGVDTLWFNPLLRLALRRRGLRRGRLPAGRAPLRHQRRPGGAGRGGPGARHPGAARPRRRAHLDRAPVVPGASCTPTGRTRTATATSGAEERPDWTGPPTSPAPPAWVRLTRARGRAGTSRTSTTPQPALNFGWTRVDRCRALARRRGRPRPAAQPRRCSGRSSTSGSTKGVAGFRVDMAFSLVKDDQDAEAGMAATTRCGARSGSGSRSPTPRPSSSPRGSSRAPAAPLAFDADFFLVILAEHASLFDNHGAGMLPFQEPQRALLPRGRARLHRGPSSTAGPDALAGRPGPAGDPVLRRPRLRPAVHRPAHGPSSSVRR